jgi:SPX domain protein involved in polyphosphate accumulation
LSASERFERKYHLTPGQYHSVRNIVRAFMVPDSYTARAGGRYLVRSLYYDTRDFAAFHERNEGNYGRIKLRIRAYGDDPGEAPPVRVELKTKKGNSMTKYSSFAGFGEYERFMEHSSWGDPCQNARENSPPDPVLAEFERLYHVRGLVPTLLVQYLREGYRSRDGIPVRVTLDHNVHSCRARELFPRNPLLKPHRPRSIVLEIKTNSRNEPDWLRHIVRNQALKVVSNSKYVQGIEIVRPYMVTPRSVA